MPKVSGDKKRWFLLLFESWAVYTTDEDVWRGNSHLFIEVILCLDL